MKKRIVTILLAGALALSLAACGGSSGSSSSSSAKQESTEVKTVSEKPETEAVSEKSEAETDSEKPEAETASEKPEAETSSEQTETEPASVNPYAWQGLEDMPQCNYLDLYCSYHYIQDTENYVMSFITEQTEAVDGINSYKEASSQRTWSVDGYVLSVNDTAKQYMEYDLGETLVEEAKKNLDDAMQSGTNITGRVYQGSGKGPIPVYSDQGDETEYEYYEYLTDGSTDTYTAKTTERFYMKDGDVFAIYTDAVAGSMEVESASVIQSISGDIPEGTFDLPDLTDYEAYS